VRGSVLLVEDDLDLLGYYELLLQLEGFRVWDACPTGEAALAHLRQSTERPDAVVLDHRLPGMSGLDVAREILALDPHASIVFATADESAREQARVLGIRWLRSKPFDADLLVRDLEEATEERARRGGG
jgi:DNA-binding response OmpR family regulator